MTEFKTVIGKPWHCGAISRRLRQDQAQATIALGFREHQTTSVVFAMSLVRRAWFIDGRLAALGGFITSSLDDDAIVWAAISQMCSQYPIATFRTAVANLKEFLATRRSISTTVVRSDARSVEFAKRLGFEATGDEAADGRIIVMKLSRGRN